MGIVNFFLSGFDEGCGVSTLFLKFVGSILGFWEAQGFNGSLNLFLLSYILGIWTETIVRSLSDTLLSSLLQQGLHSMMVPSL